ncbi:Aste57867_5923 [Aphanomyces stellatus]|uniref:Aste57867_1396 protein n=1 Tax=Aphanomyces stellatus TaxID=120398 RepID=A0A485KHN0_9STRA|nr:hypothetical protein As57867_005909 [Aphanomyces stellatus]KAF0718917.1 hypothetical protein As57867_001395 [Aphanomyces stellatus]VFT78613.1 Aste57867_1396 [Aphanomyces stellatus]VFT82944.1 Aste57867_5923 [Aphanomyces stellatus]
MVISKQCHLVQVDFQVVCTSANITIGDVSRLATLVVVVIGTNILCYIVTRVLVRSPRQPRVNSNMLYAGAKFLFETSSWIYSDVYYMDRMSAVVNGIVTVQWGRVMYGLDVKLWCTFQVSMARQVNVDNGDFPIDVRMIDRAKFALPLSVSGDRQKSVHARMHECQQ